MTKSHTPQKRDMQHVADWDTHSSFADVNLQRAIFQALSNLFTPVSSTDVSQKEEKKTSSKLDDLCKVYFGGKSREDDIVS